MSSAAVAIVRPHGSAWTHAARPRAGASLSPALATFCISFLLLAGMYFPSSGNYSIPVPLSLVSGAMLGVSLLALLVRRGGLLSSLPVVNAAVINAIMIGATMLSPFTDFAYGALLPTLLLGLLFCLNLRDVELTGPVRRLFTLTHAINIAAGVLVIQEFVMESDHNGLRGRYGGSGGLAANVRYLSDHPFSPIGAGFSSELIYGDSGPLPYLIRGSFPLMIAVHPGLYLFPRKNMLPARRARFLFLIYLGFEVGYSNLQDFRHYLLPFVAVYLNGLDRLGTGKARGA